MKLTKDAAAFAHFPAEVREEDFTLHAKGLVKDVIGGLKAGNYMVTVDLPDASKLTTRIDLDEAHADADSAPAEIFAQLHERIDTLSEQRNETGPEAALASLNEQVRLRDTGGLFPATMYRGDPLGSPCADEALYGLPLRSTIGFPADPDVRVLQFRVHGRTPRNIVIPPCSAIELGLRQDNERHVFQVRFLEPDTNQLAFLLEQGQFEQALAVAMDVSKGLLARRLCEDYGASLIVCYALLRSPEYQRLEAVLADLPDEVRARTDIRIVEGELLARSGHDDLALQTFIAAASSGVPCITEGLNTIFDRLSFYRMIASTEANTPLDSLGDLAAFIQERLPRLRDFATFSDQTSVLTSYCGSQPAVPEPDELQSKEQQSAELSALMRAFERGAVNETTTELPSENVTQWRTD